MSLKEISESIVPTKWRGPLTVAVLLILATLAYADLKAEADQAKGVPRLEKLVQRICDKFGVRTDDIPK